MDIALPEELVLEGLYRDLLRQCQLLRKEADLPVDQKILLSVKTDSVVMKSVMSKFSRKIAEETLASELADNIDGPILTKEVEVGGHLVIVQIR